MKKIFKYLNLLFVSLLGVFALVSCGDDGKNDSNLPKLSDEEIQNNFDEEISKTRTKDEINSEIGEALKGFDSSELLAQIDKINVPNTKGTITAYGTEDGTSSGTEISEEIGSVYVWQDEKVIYFGESEDDLRSLDLNELKTIIGSTSSTTTEGENVDYVGTILSYISSDVDFDAISALLTFEGSDFTYSDGYFTLKEEAIINKIGGETLGQTVYKSYVNSLTIKLGYDGYHFTGLVVEYVPGAALAESVDVSKTYVKLNVKLSYNEYDLTSVSVDADVSVVGTNEEVVKFKGSISLSASSLSINGNFEIAEKHIGKYSGSINLEATLKSLVVEATVEGYASVRDVDSETGVVTYSYGTDKYSASVNVNINETSISCLVKLNDKKAIEVSGTVSDLAIKSLTATIYTEVINASSDATKIVVVVTTDNVEIPAEYIAGQANARNILNFAS